MSSLQSNSAQEKFINWLLKYRQSQTQLVSALDAGIAFLNHEQYKETGFGFLLCNCRLDSSQSQYNRIWIQLNGTECRHTPCGRTRSLCDCKISWTVELDEIDSIEPSTPPLNTAQELQEQREEREEMESRFGDDTNK